MVKDAKYLSYIDDKREDLALYDSNDYILFIFTKEILTGKILKNVEQIETPLYISPSWTNPKVPNNKTTQLPNKEYNIIMYKYKPDEQSKLDRMFGTRNYLEQLIYTNELTNDSMLDKARHLLTDSYYGTVKTLKELFLFSIEMRRYDFALIVLEKTFNQNLQTEDIQHLSSENNSLLLSTYQSFITTDVFTKVSKKQTRKITKQIKISNLAGYTRQCNYGFFRSIRESINNNPTNSRTRSRKNKKQKIHRSRFAPYRRFRRYLPIW